MTLARCGGVVMAIAATMAMGGAVGAQNAVQGPPVPVADAVPDVPRPAAVSPALFTAVERATQDYPSIQAARGLVKAARADVRAAKNQRLPSVSVEGVALGTGGGLGSQLVVDQPVYTFGRLGASIDRAKAERYARAAEVDVAALNVAIDTVTAYYEIARLAKRQAILGESLDEHRLLLSSIGRRVEQEVSAQSDLELAKSRVAQLEQDLALTAAQRQASAAQLFQLVGDNSYDAGNVPSYDPAVHHPDPTKAVEEAIACSPTRERLTAQRLVAKADTRQAKSAFLPQLSAQYSYNNLIGSRAGLAVTAQTTGGLSNLATADAARARETSSELDIRTAERELREQITSDLVENASARGRITAGVSASGSAVNVTESFKRQFIAGRRTWLDVMNATREATTAELGSSDAEVGAMASAARILLRTCRWQPQPRLASTITDVPK